MYLVYSSTCLYPVTYIVMISLQCQLHNTVIGLLHMRCTALSSKRVVLCDQIILTRYYAIPTHHSSRPASRVYNEKKLEVEVDVGARSNLQHVAVSTWDKEAAFACVAIREFDQHDKSLNPTRERVSGDLMRQAAPRQMPAQQPGQQHGVRRPNEFRRQANRGHHHRGGAVPAGMRRVF